MENLRKEIKEKLQAWYVNPKDALDSIGSKSLYFSIAASALAPAAAAWATNDPAVLSHIASLGSGVGMNLVANILQRWKNENSAAAEMEAEAQIHPELVQALDQILLELDAIKQIQDRQKNNDREWFAQTLRTEIQKIHSGIVIYGNGNIAINGLHLYISMPDTSKDAEEQAFIKTYLNSLIEQIRFLSLAGVDKSSVIENARPSLDLAAVYTALMTQSIVKESATDSLQNREKYNLSALEMLNSEAHLALLGDPGSGKSTFVNFVALCLAGEALGLPDANISALKDPLPDRGNKTDEKPEPQPWDHGFLLPVRVVLRDLAARGLPPIGDHADYDTLWRFMLKEIPLNLAGFGELLRKRWLYDGGLLLLDGLDEVPEADERREQVKDAVEKFVAVFPRVRVLVTSRTYAYQKQAWKLNGFKEAVLAPFGKEQIRRFINGWYEYGIKVRGLRQEDARGRAVQLKQAIERNARLAELAARPLLLTLMASLHDWRNSPLPEQREELYFEAVELLLNQWESQKLRRKPDGSFELIQPSLAEWMQVDRKRVRKLLERLAFEAHRDQKNLHGTADIEQNTLIVGLMNLNPSLDARPARLIEYVRDRAGLLEPRGVGIYAFPHRTFQEYLSACYLTGDGFPNKVADLARSNPDRWREVALLAGAKVARGTPWATWNLADALCYEDVSSGKWEKNAWGALLASQVLIENDCLADIDPCNKSKFDCIQQWLVFILNRGLLPAIDRALAGDALARLGDTRDLEQLVEIPSGPFKMGSDKNIDKQSWDGEIALHEVPVAGFKIGKYPVTVKQWKCFIEATSYETDSRALQGLGNHPVVNVSWNDARAFCSWLTTEWRQSGKISDAEVVRLPTEAEWEKAARGDDGRIWPWGNEFGEGNANTWESNVIRTTAVGCFPSDKSPYGVMDLAGNVFEWCQSEYKPYPYKADDGRESLDGDEYRVVRGGCFYSFQRFARCAARYGSPPDNRYDSLGFRVVVSPGF